MARPQALGMHADADVYVDENNVKVAVSHVSKNAVGSTDGALFNVTGETSAASKKIRVVGFKISVAAALTVEILSGGSTAQNVKSGKTFLAANGGWTSDGKYRKYWESSNSIGIGVDINDTTGISVGIDLWYVELDV